MTSKNIKPEMNDFIARELLLTKTISLGRYLGLLSQNARDKKVIFREVKDRVWKSLQGWKEKFFSSGGKEVLIKVVAQAIPTYTMGCFKLPSSLCGDLQSSFAKFWWGSTDSKRKIHWWSWKKMCKSKIDGGMSFRDLSMFNQALLAKQCWRISRNPDSLVAKVLKGRYFSMCNSLKAEIGNNPSFVGRSLMWGRELLLKGIRWKIGNGFGVSIESDCWLLNEGSCKLSRVPNHLRGQCVANLIMENVDTHFRPDPPTTLKQTIFTRGKT